MEPYRGSVLLVEDNEKLNETNARALELRGYEVYAALTLEEARLRLLQIEPDVILLDVTLPDGSGFDFCKEIRDVTTAHILFLTAKTNHEDMVQGMRLGGDAYITKPFHLEEVLVKVDAAIRRRRMDQVQIIKKGPLILDIMAIQAFGDNGSLRLTPIEFALLLLFVKHEGRPLSSSHICDTVWKVPVGNNRNALQTAISKLRRKIEPTGHTIIAQRGEGYIFQRN